MGAADYPVQSDTVGFHMAWLALNNNETILSVRRIENFCHNKKFLKKPHFCLVMKLQVTIMFFLNVRRTTYARIY
jgi:hypothetical protein